MCHSRIGDTLGSHRPLLLLPHAEGRSLQRRMPTEGSLSNVTHLPCRFIIGEPIPPPKLEVGQEPTQEQVDATHATFYEALETLWHKHAPSFPGYEGAKFVLVDK